MGKVLELLADANEMRQLLATRVVWLRELDYLSINPPEEGEEVPEPPERVKVFWRSAREAKTPRVDAAVVSAGLFHDATPRGGRGRKKDMCYIRLGLEQA